MTMIQCKNVSKSYGSIQVLKNINLEIQAKEIISIVGASGAGKSTLLQIIGTLDRPDAGLVEYNGENVLLYKEKKLSSFRNSKIGFIFQFHQLLPEFTALENICIPAFIKGTSRKNAEKKARELLDYLNLSQRESHKPSELSGGEQQRIAVARALINDPKVILADEPSGNLDSENATELHQLFKKLRDDFQQTFVLVTHNEHFAKDTDRQLMMKDGSIVEMEN